MGSRVKSLSFLRLGLRALITFNRQRFRPASRNRNREKPEGSFPTALAAYSVMRLMI